MKFPEPEKNGFTVYSKTNCIYCIRAKNILDNQYEEVSIIECDTFLEKDKDEFLNFIYTLTKTHHRTFPIVFHNGGFIGGFVELKSHLDKLGAFDSVTF